MRTDAYPLPDERPRWRTPDQAIASTITSPLDARAIDLTRLPGGQAQAEEALVAYSHVVAIVGQFDLRTQFVLVGWAHGMGYRQLERVALKLGIQSASRRTLQRLHRPAWEHVRERLQALGLVG